METQGFWREVPCGHPPDPIAARSLDGHLSCHCGRIMDENGPLIQHCDKCGCHTAKHYPTAAELDVL